nr:hypothetical protein Iba_scaffold11157CG0040 [Ipomoea batatas]GME21485.1 hypothetical protein Iba_scaffold27980CG0010 [Ipomoea batatas]
MVAGVLDKATDDGEELKKMMPEEVYVIGLEDVWLSAVEMEISDLFHICDGIQICGLELTCSSIFQDGTVQYFNL